MKIVNTIEVIIPTYNRPDSIIEVFNSIFKQTVKPVKLTVVDAGVKSADYRKYQKSFDDQKIEFKLIKSEPGLTHQRNTGIKEAQYDVILFLDDDVVLDNKYIENVINVFNLFDMVGGITGRILNATDGSSILSYLFRKIFFLNHVREGRLLSSGFPTSINFENQSTSKVEVLSGCNMAYRLEVIKEFQFDELLSKYAYMEDVDYSYRVSKKFSLIYTSEAILNHNTAPEGRLNDFDRFRMLLLHHHYLFKKNCNLNFKSRLAHILSIIGVTMQALILRKSIQAFRGCLLAILELITKKKVLPL